MDWMLDPEALDRARVRMNLRFPVTVKVTGLRKHAGRYKGLTKGKHQITVSRYLCVSEAGATVWHEIAHAKQREGHRSHEAFLKAHGADTLMEAAAEAAERLNGRFPLCVPK